MFRSFLVSTLVLVAAFATAGGCTLGNTPGTDAATGSDSSGDPFDFDGDGIPASIDCDDFDATNFPGNTETLDGRDNDCDGVIDDGIVGANYDADGDGFTVETGDCNDANPDVNPDAEEVPLNLLDDNCDGNIDEVNTTIGGGCDCPMGNGYAEAIGLCQGVMDVTVTGPALAHEISTGWTSEFGPTEGCAFIHLSTGLSPMFQGMAPGGYTNDPGCDFDTAGNGDCLGASGDGSETGDETSVVLTFEVPMGANTLGWDFAFFSVEYPEWVGLGFNDTFEANITSMMFSGNASFDENGDPINVDNVLFDTTCDGFIGTCDPALTGTGYDDTIGGGGSTHWLRTETPVVPGEVVTLEFKIYDSGDGVLDSAVIIDNMLFTGGFTKGGPGTNPIQ